MDKLNHLRTTDLFQDLDEEELAALEQRMPHAMVEAGRPIYSPQEQGEVLFILKEGRVRLYRLSPEGKTLTTAIVEPGAVFGEMALLGQGMHESFAEALEDCVICTLRSRDIREVLLDDPRVAWRLLELIGRRLVQVERKLGDFAFKSVPERLASLLVQLAENPSGEPGGPLTIAHRYTHQQLAEMIGTYRETVTKLLNNLRDQQIIHMKGGRIQLLDIDALQEMTSA